LFSICRIRGFSTSPILLFLRAITSSVLFYDSGPMDSVIKIQLRPDRDHSAQEYVHMLRDTFNSSEDFSGLEFAFDAGGMIRGAMNEGKLTPINVLITGKELAKANEVAAAIQAEVTKIDGVVDCRILQRLDYPEYTLTAQAVPGVAAAPESQSWGPRAASPRPGQPRQTANEEGFP
jgi:hypothetical protein